MSSLLTDLQISAQNTNSVTAVIQFKTSHNGDDENRVITENNSLSLKFVYFSMTWPTMTHQT